MDRYDAQEWAEAMLTIAAFCLAMATFAGWAFGLLALPTALIGARIIRAWDLAPPATECGRTD